MSISRPRVTVTDSLELLAPGIELLRREGVTIVELEPGSDPISAAQLSAGSDAILVGVMDFGEEGLALLSGGPTRLIVRAGIGYDNVDVAAARLLGINVSNVPDYCTDEVADHTILLILAAERRLTTLKDLGVDSWNTTSRLPLVRRLRGRILGIVGLGRIGQSVARRAAAFGYRIIASDPIVEDAVFESIGVEKVDLDRLFELSDTVTLHCPLSPTKEKLVNAARLQTMKPGSILVNSSRGGLVDLDAVHEGLESGILSSVALDVLDGEPDPPLGHPLLKRPEVLVTPHVAWYSAEARTALAIMSAEEILRSLRGEPLRNPVQ
jgi:D-3-phosphoglycerate dehydrogenase